MKGRGIIMDCIFAELREISRKLDELYYMFSSTPEEAAERQADNIFIHLLKYYMYDDETKSWNYQVSKELVTYLLPVIRSKKYKRHPTGKEIHRLLMKQLLLAFDDCYDLAQKEKEGEIKNPDAYDKTNCHKFVVEVIDKLFKNTGNMNGYISYKKIENALLDAGAKKYYK